jgi:hypothetical protein
MTPLHLHRPHTSNLTNHNICALAVYADEIYKNDVEMHSNPTFGDRGSRGDLGLLGEAIGSGEADFALSA